LREGHEGEGRSETIKPQIGEKGKVFGTKKKRDNSRKKQTQSRNAAAKKLSRGKGTGRGKKKVGR